jgi:hypothetical protein
MSNNLKTNIKKEKEKRRVAAHPILATPPWAGPNHRSRHYTKRQTVFNKLIVHTRRKKGFG